MDNALARINEIADRDVPDVAKFNGYLVAVLDTSVAYLIRRDLEDPGSLRREGFTEIADLLGR
ncbi:hypothetical protein ACIBBG_33965 [Micromonospora chersina]|uniref:hypothetical protein n=1 Tax=Micromonospora chersina TaxID=47854 RepID=UPI003788007D